MKLNVFETFAGIGSQHKALEFIKQNYNFDYEIVATCEWDAYANIAYHLIHANNFDVENIDLKQAWQYLNQFTHSLDGQNVSSMKMIEKKGEKFVKLLYSSFKTHNNLGSILDVDAKKLLNHIKHKQVDLITYSFPCQDLSVAGSFHGFNQGMIEGSGTRSSLLWQIGKILTELKRENKLPKFLLLENVKNMISSRHKDQYIKWLNHLKTLGYKTDTYVLNAKDYGIPQSRVRVYAISYLDKDAKNIDYSNFKIHESIKNPKKQIKKSMEDILKFDYSNNDYYHEAFNACPNDTASRKRMYDQNHKLISLNQPQYQHKHLYQEINNLYFRQYCSTITKKQDRHPNAGIIEISKSLQDEFTKKYQNEKNTTISKSNYRFITSREAYMLMGFEEIDYLKVKSQNIQNNERFYQQAGNSIVVNAMVALMYKIQCLFYKEKRE